MNRIQKLLAGYKRENKKALSIFLTAGYPDTASTEELVLEVSEYADIIELGVPFSDPVADGPTIQYSSQKALEKGINLKKILAIVKRIRKKTAVPLVIMSYLNPVYGYGLKKFFGDAAAAGIDGVIFPDMPYEESRPVLGYAREYGVSFIPLIALTSEKNRAEKIAELSTGFVYVTAVTGVTGARSSVSGDLIPFLESLRKKTSNPVFVGFGISRPEHILKLKRHCDGFIIGSAVIDIIRRKKSLPEFLKKICTAL